MAEILKPQPFQYSDSDDLQKYDETKNLIAEWTRIQKNQPYKCYSGNRRYVYFEDDLENRKAAKQRMDDLGRGGDEFNYVPASIRFTRDGSTL